MDFFKDYDSDKELRKRKPKRQKPFKIEELRPKSFFFSGKWFTIGSYETEKDAIKALNRFEKRAENSTYDFVRESIYRIVKKN